MTDYNDGQWHGWNGGECPVHPKTEVDAVFGDGGKQCSIAGSHLDWSGPDVLPRSYVAAFRVVKAYREPREWWLVNGSVAMASLPAAKALCEGNEGYTITHVREVME